MVCAIMVDDKSRSENKYPMEMYQIRRKVITWETLQLFDVITPNEMFYALNEENVITKLTSSNKRKLVARFKRRFKNHPISEYLQYKDGQLFQSFSYLKRDRISIKEALLLLDFHYLTITKHFTKLNNGRY